MIFMIGIIYMIINVRWKKMNQLVNHSNQKNQNNHSSDYGNNGQHSVKRVFGTFKIGCKR